jgi:hypothetical protein
MAISKAQERRYTGVIGTVLGIFLRYSKLFYFFIPVKLKDNTPPMLWNTQYGTVRIVLPKLHINKILNNQSIEQIKTNKS